MDAHPRFRLTREAALALAVSSALSGAAGAAQVARVQFAVGDVTATGTDGRTRTLGRGAEVREGDTVNTETGRAQLRFSDGAYVSLQPRTAFRVDQYRFAGKTDGSERGFFSLLRGALRTITGAIGKTSRDSYRVTTSTATIGIRGTEFLADVSGSLRVSVGGGVISITNQAGTFLIEQGQSAYVADQGSLPVITFDKPILPPSGTSEAPAAPEIDTENVAVIERETSPPVTEPPPAEGTTIAGVGAFATPVGGLTLGDGTVTLNAANEVTRFAGSEGEVFERTTAQAAESSYDGTIGVGRWTNGELTATTDTGEGFVTETVALGATQGAHYVFGVPTASLPTATGVTTYNLLASTQATSLDGSQGLGTVSPGAGAGQPIMGVDFANGRVGLDFAVAFPTDTYRVQTTGGVMNPTASEVRTFGVIFANTLPVPTSTGEGCGTGESPSCTTDVLGFFAGTGASRAGFTYEITDPVAEAIIQGAIAATKGGTLNLVTGPAATTVNTMLFNHPSGTAVLTSTNQLDSYTSPGSGESYVRGTATVPESSWDGTIGTSRWASGTATAVVDDDGLNTVNLNLGANQGLHFAFGAPVTNLPGSGTALYTLLAATKATADAGTLGQGIVVPSAGTGQPILGVDFGNAKVGVDFSVAFPSTTYRVATTGGVYDPSNSELSVFGSTFSGSMIPTTDSAANCTGSGGCGTYLNGFFSGDAAARAGFTYTLWDPTASQWSQGAVATTKGGPIATTPLAASFVYDTGSAGGQFSGPGAGVHDAAGRLFYFSGEEASCCGTIAMMSGNATFADTGHDGTVGFGRLSNGTVTTEDGFEGYGGPNIALAAAQGLHYAFGTLTPAMPASGLATYSKIGATNATSSTGALGSGVFAGSLAVDFALGAVGADFTVTFPSASYHATTTGGLANPVNSQIQVFSGAHFRGSGIPTTGGGSGCLSGCNTYVKGFFAGADASRAGMTYEVFDQLGEVVTGAATFSRGGITAAPGGGALVGENLTLNFAAARDELPFGSATALGYENISGSVDSRGAIVQFNESVGQTRIGSVTATDIGNDGTIGWTRWTGDGTTAGFSTAHSGRTLTGNQSFHAVFGAPTPSGDLTTLVNNSILATYALLGATQPTLSDSGGTSAVGVLNSASMTADFGAAAVAFNANVAFGATSYSVTNLPGTITGAAFSGSGSAFGTGGACTSTCSAAINGFFAGANAARAGVAYHINDSVTGKNVAGAAAMTQTSAVPNPPQ